MEITLQEMKNLIGKEISLGGWLEVTQKMINQFAECTGANDWIHVDIARSDKGPYGRPIAQGLLTLSLLPKLQSEIRLSIKGAKMEINYGLNKVRFISPVPVGSKIRVRSILKNLEEKEAGTVLLTINRVIEIEGIEKPACVAETLSLSYI